MDQSPKATGSYTSKALRGVFWSSVNALLPAISGFVVFIVISRYIGPSEFGLVALSNGVVAAVTIFLPLGFGEALVQRSELTEAHWSSVFWSCAISSVVLYLLLFTLSDEVSRLFGIDGLGPVIRWVGVKLVLDAASIVPQALITRRIDFALIARRTAVATTVSSIVALALIFTGYGLWALVYSQLAASLASLVAVFWGSGWLPTLLLRRAPLRDLAHYGFFSSGTRAIQLITNQADAAFVGYALGVGQAGIYSFSRRIFQLITDVVSGSIGTVAHPLFSAVQGDIAKVRNGFLMATFLSVCCAMPMFVGFAVVSDRAIPAIFGSAWTDAIWPIRIYCALGLMTAIGVVQSGLILSRGLADWWFYYQMVAGVTTLVILAFAAQHGVVFLLTAILIKTALLWPFSFVKAASLVRVPVRSYLLQFFPAVISTAGMVVVVLLCEKLMSGRPDILVLIFEIILGGVVYLAILMAISSRRFRDIYHSIRSSGRRSEV